MMNLRVAEGTNPTRLGASIAANIQRDGEVSVTSIGMAALNQAIKGFATAHGKPDFLWIRPGGSSTIEDGRKVRQVVLHGTICSNRQVVTLASVKETLRVAHDTDPGLLADSIKHAFHGDYTDRCIVLQCIGVSAVDKGVKSTLALRRAIPDVWPEELGVRIIPFFETLTIEEREVTSIALRVALVELKISI